jgi:uncharacterized protein YbcI
MKKLTNAQIREQVRKELVKSFERKYEAEMKSLESFKNLYHKTLEEKRELSKEIFTLTGENEALKEKVTQYEDWIRRLQEFMDMQPDAREEAIQKFKTEKELNETMNSILKFYSGFTSMLF